MSYKRTLPDGMDYAVPSRKPLPPTPPPPPPCPKPGPPSVPFDWNEYPYYPPFIPEEPIEPVDCPPIPGRRPVPPPPVPPPYFPPYPMPTPEKVDKSSKKLAKLSQKAKVLVQMIKDFEQRNKPAIITIGPNSYQFGTENVVDFEGEPAKGMYSALICGSPIETLDPMDYEVDETNTRVALKDPVDLLQSELARVRLEITLVAAALNDEVQEPQQPQSNIPGTGE